ncbi:D,D-heptose 1,7-bisphosphate phosphatase [Parapedobacter composti]|uniref:D,D-heptose 1,7-bisphosphate phosphatase n=1 Tax=Parapedobacter composti TaxID=623281 RepID=A0A1I1EE49_9SPHI|nr:HAD family hydrolase [Parapedobacter composti]SFB85337.1 D,D-heptose 1,7-bisphosphate phosphatase [Parapedobacter composti]
MSGKKAVFLDKDGTLIRDVPYNADPSKVELLHGVASGLRQLSNKGYLFFIVTNQAGVAKGYFKEEALTAVEHKLQLLLHQSGIALSGFYYCPHHPQGVVAAYAKACHCRKPMPGMLFDAATRHGLSLAQSWMVGDILDDIEAGNRAGCRTVLVDGTASERVQISGGYRRPSYIADNFKEAANLIVKNT